MDDDILVPTDGSAGAEAAVGRALDLATTSGATVHVLSVVEEDLPRGAGVPEEAEVHELVEAGREEASIAIRDRAMDLELATVSEVRRGTPYRTILEYAESADVDLIVMGTHGRTGAALARVGSTTERVISRAPVPVLTVRRWAADTTGDSALETYDHIVVPTDGSDPAGRAATNAFDWAERFGADVHVVYVVDTTTFDLEDAPRSIIGLLREGGRKACDELAAEAEERGLPVTTDVLRGAPSAAILEYAEGVDADLIALGTRGRTPASDRLLGSTTARIVRRSEVPTLVTT